MHEANVPNPDAAVRCAAVQPAARPAGLAKYSASSRQSATVPSVSESWNEMPGTIPSRMPGIVVPDQVLLDRAARAAPADRVLRLPVRLGEMLLHHQRDLGRDHLAAVVVVDVQGRRRDGVTAGEEEVGEHASVARSLVVADVAAAAERVDKPFVPAGLVRERARRRGRDRGGRRSRRRRGRSRPSRSARRSRRCARRASSSVRGQPASRPGRRASRTRRRSSGTCSAPASARSSRRRARCRARSAPSRRRRAPAAGPRTAGRSAGGSRPRESRRGPAARPCRCRSSARRSRSRQGEPVDEPA